MDDNIGRRPPGGSGTTRTGTSQRSLPWVDVAAKRRPGVRVRIRWDAGRWSVTTNSAGFDLVIARRSFPRLQKVITGASSIGAELELTDDHLAQLWDSARIGATDQTLSRYEVPTPGVGDHAVVGWDRPLGTYFAQVWEDEVEGERPIGWIGADPGEIPTLAGFLRRAGVYAVIDDATGAQLLYDRITKGTRPLPW